MTVLLEPGQQGGRNKGFTLLNWGSGWRVDSGMCRWPRRAWLSRASVSAALWYGGPSQQQSYLLLALAWSTVTLMGNIPCGLVLQISSKLHQLGFLKGTLFWDPLRATENLDRGASASSVTTKPSPVTSRWCGALWQASYLQRESCLLHVLWGRGGWRRINISSTMVDSIKWPFSPHLHGYSERVMPPRSSEKNHFFANLAESYKLYITDIYLGSFCLSASQCLYRISVILWLSKRRLIMK